MADQSAANQRQRIKRYIMENGSANTIEIRENLGIMHPSGRVKELHDKDGLPIVKRLISVIDSAGEQHHGVANYSIQL